MVSHCASSVRATVNVFQEVESLPPMEYPVSTVSHRREEPSYEQGRGLQVRLIFIFRCPFAQCIVVKI